MVDCRAIARAISDPENQPHQWNDQDLAKFFVSAANEIERLREVLKPFAEIADDWDHLDDEDYVSVHRYDISIKHFRAIRAALQKKESE